MPATRLRKVPHVRPHWPLTRQVALSLTPERYTCLEPPVFLDSGVLDAVHANRCFLPSPVKPGLGLLVARFRQQEWDYLSVIVEPRTNNGGKVKSCCYTRLW